MTQRSQVYKCNVCGNIIEVVHSAGGNLVCCEKPMELKKENSLDAAVEKHVPVLKKTANGIEVRIGSVSHPMEEKHYIEWIELSADNRLCRKYLKPGEEPEALFEMKSNRYSAREYCNLHGLWKGEL